MTHNDLRALDNVSPNTGQPLDLSYRDVTRSESANLCISLRFWHQSESRSIVGANKLLDEPLRFRVVQADMIVAQRNAGKTEETVVHTNEVLYTSKHIERKRGIAKGFNLGIRILEVAAPFEAVIASFFRANGILMDVAEGY